MKKFFLNTGSVVLALIVWFSTWSFVVDKHFCDGSLVDLAVFSSAKKCKSEMASYPMKESVHMTFVKDSCCSNKKENIQGQNELKFSSFSFELIQQDFAILSAFILADFLCELFLQKIPNLFYKPPLLVTDIQVIDQKFLI